MCRKGQCGRWRKRATEAEYDANTAANMQLKDKTHITDAIESCNDMNEDCTQLKTLKKKEDEVDINPLRNSCISSEISRYVYNTSLPPNF